MNKEGKAEGFGRFTNDKYGDVYEGTFVRNQMESYCTVIYSSQDVYVGEMKASKFNGKCTYYSSKGAIWNQIYSNGELAKQIKVFSQNSRLQISNEEEANDKVWFKRWDYD